MDQKKQVKDYYKILGVKPIASPEEIHARWIELMRKFHPDRGKYEALEDERAREINEAYGVLKDSSSRSEYDLRRAYQRKKKSLYLQRVITPPAVFIILLILALVYLQRPGSVRPAKSSLPSTRGSIQNKTNPLSSPVVNELNLPNQTNPNEIDQIDQTNQAHQKDETDQIDQRDQTNQIDQRKSPRHPNPTPTSKSQQSPHIKTRTNQTNETDEIDETNQIIQPLPMSVSKERKAYPLFAKAKTSITVNNATPSPGEPSHRDEINLINQTNQTDQTDQIDEINQIAALDILTKPDSLKAPNQPNLIAETDQTDQITSIRSSRYRRLPFAVFLQSRPEWTRRV